MLSISKFIVLSSALLAVNAQSTTDTSAGSDPSGITGIPGLTPCVLACIQPAAEANNCDFTDVSCVCTSAQFQADATACLVAHCTADEQQAALQLQSAQCASVGTPTGSATTTNSLSFTLSGSTAAATTSGTNGTTPSTTGSGTTRTTGILPTTGSGASNAASNTPTSPSGSPPSTTTPSAGEKIAVNGVLALGAIVAGAFFL